MFNKENLINYFNSYKPNFYYNKLIHKNVIYNEHEQKELLIQIIEKALKSFNHLENNKTINYKIVETLIKDLQYEAPFFKHPYWKEENEYRFVFFRKYNDKKLVNIKFNPKPKYEGLDSNQTYIDLPLDTNLFKKIIIGPCNNTDINKFINNYDFLNTGKFIKSKGYGIVRKFIV